MSRAEVEAMVKVWPSSIFLILRLACWFVCDVNPLLQEADKDSNGEIDFTEFKQIMASLQGHK